MESERDLDFYVSTPDAHFNHNAQGMYFEFTGNKKPAAQQNYLTLIDGIYKLYFFVLDNPNKPFKCINYAQKIKNDLTFSESDYLFFLDKIISILYHYPNLYLHQIVYAQLLDYRHELQPFDSVALESEFMNAILFNVPEIKNAFRTTRDPLERIKYLANIHYDYKASRSLMSEIEMAYYESEGFEPFMLAEIERLQFEISILSNLEPEKPSLEPVKKSTFRIASKHKTDVIKILSAMYDCRLFVDAQGKPITNKQELMEAFGAFFGEDFKSYSTLLSQSKDKEYSTFIKPFEQLSTTITKYYEAE